MLHAIRFFGALRVVEALQTPHKIACHTTDALELHAFTDEMYFI